MADWEGKVQDAAARAEAELQRLIRYMNDEVVPDVRRHSSVALRTAADRLRELAQTLDDGRK
jgi:bisphosphoglycerate-dependent phosphoglycerate mutase